MPRRAVLACALLALAASAHAAQPQFWKIEGARDFLDGDTEGLSIDSEGRVRLAPATERLYDPESPYVWSLARNAQGVLFAGTGNDGRIFRIEGGKGRVFFDAPELEVHALAVAPDGRLFAGTSPDGKVYAIDENGRAETFFDPTDKYIWALAFDPQGQLLVGSGAEGRVHRVDKQGKATVLFTSAETHITALTVDGSGTVYAGSAPGGVLFRIASDGKVFVLHDSPYREVKAVDVGKDGSVYAAAVESKDGAETSRTVPVFSSTTTSAPSAEVTVTESFSVPAAAAATPTPAPSPRMTEAPRGGPAKGGVFRILPSGEVDTLWSSSDESPHSLVTVPGGAMVGTGNRGKVYLVRDDRTWTMLASFPTEQVTALLRGPAGRMAVATSNPAQLHDLGSGSAARGTFTSKPRDTETVSSWGRMRWEGDAPTSSTVQIETRSGNTGTPDSTWSDWSPLPAGHEAQVASERARFLQLRVTLTGRPPVSPVVDTLSTAYLQRNLRPQLQSVTVHAPGEVFQKPLSLTGETEILGLEPSPGGDNRPSAPTPFGGTGSRTAPPPSATTYSRKMYQKGLQTFSWKGEDANGDSLTYEVAYRSVNDTRFRQLRKGLTDAVLAWDTSTVPNGRYVIRVTASDAPSNPEGLALSGDKESVPFDVDNTPPTVSVTRAGDGRVRVVVKDDSSLVRRAEYSVDGGRWQDVHPADGINDATEETYEIQPPDMQGAGPHIVTVRASDLLGNVATGRVELP
jgi:WD40 repeat protein